MRIVLANATPEVVDESVDAGMETQSAEVTSRGTRCGRRSQATHDGIREEQDGEIRMIEIAPLRDEDWQRWNILARGYKTFYETTLSDADYDRAWERIIANDGIHGLGAHLDGILVGITHYFFHTSTWAKDVCYLQDLFVDGDLRGQGLARALIEDVARAARERGARHMYWNTRHDNATARALYDKVAVHKGFIRYDYLF